MRNGAHPKGTKMGIGVAFVLMASVLGILMRFRFLPSRPLYRGALELLFATGVGFMIPNFVYVDVLVIFTALILWDAWRHLKKR